MSKRSILVLTTSYPSAEDDPSGIFIAKLLGSLQKLGYTVKVVAPSDGTFHGERAINGIDTVRFGYFLPRSLEKLTRSGGGIPEHMSESLLARMQLFPMMLAFLIVTLKEVRKSDLIYANWLGAGIIGAMANTLTSKPLVISFRGDDGYLARERPIWRVLTRWVARRASVIAPVSAELVRILIDLGIPKEKCRLPQFGVDREMFFPPEKREPDPDLVRLLFVGSLIERKGLHDLLEALADPALNTVELTVVGDGIQGPFLKSMCQRLGLHDRTRWKGVLPPKEVARLMRESDILCLPSYMEGRPNVVNEAMASGLPVISTRIGGIPDMVAEGESALLFDPGDAHELRDHLKKLVHDPPLRLRMGTAGRRFLERAGVSWDATAQEFHDIFSHLA